MKKILIIVFLLLLNCSIYKFLKKDLSEECHLRHIDHISKVLYKEGFTIIIGNVKEGRIYVPVKINCIYDNFFIDTGSTYTFLNHGSISNYQLKKLERNFNNNDITTYFGKISHYEIALVDEFELGSQIFTQWPFIIDKRDNNALFGTDFLHYTNSVIICKYGILYINTKHQKADNISDSLKTFGYHEIDLILYENDRTYPHSSQSLGNTHKSRIGTFTVKANLNGIECYLLIDTGASYTTIDYDLAKMTGRQIRTQNKFYFSDATDNVSYPSMLSSDSLKINDYFLAKKCKIPILKKINNNNSPIPLPFTGIIGMDYLIQNNAIMDFGNRKLYLIK